MNSPIRFGVAGLGIAATQVLPAIQALEGAEVAAAADHRPEPRAAFEHEFGRFAYPTVEALCTDPNVDVVYVCTPTTLHAEHALLAIHHGKHVILEKPLALTLVDCDAMIAAADHHAVQLMAGHTHYFDAPVRALRALAGGGDLGRLVALHGWYFNDYLYRPRMPQELDTARGGGAVFTQAPHHVDILRHIANSPVRAVRASTQTLDPARPTEGGYVAYLTFVNGVVATLVYSGYAHFDTAELLGWVAEDGRPRPPDAHATTRARLTQIEDEPAYKRSMRYGGPRQGEFPFGRTPHSAQPPTAHPHFGLLLASFERGDVRQAPDGLYVYGQDGTRQDVPLPLAPGERVAEIQELCAALRERRPVQHNARWGQHTLAVCLAILQSARENREIVLTP